jgi:hypothetical protein
MAPPTDSTLGSDPIQCTRRGGPQSPPAVPYRPLTSTVDKLKTILPSPPETIEAISKLSIALSKIDVKYGLIGGAAVLLYAERYGLPKRLTADIDIIIQPDLKTKFSAEEVTRRLCSEQFSEDFAVKRISGLDTPQARVKRGEQEVLIDVKVLDHHVWAERRPDYDLRLSGNKLVELKIFGQVVFLLNAPWMLRQKILTWNDRKGRKRWTDDRDIEMLCDVLSEATMTLKIRGERDIRKLKAFLKDFEHDPGVLGAVVDCPEAFGPWYDLKWVRRTFAGFLFIVVPLAYDYLTFQD